MTTSSYESLSHAKWDWKYPVVFLPKGRKKALYGKIRGFRGPVLRELAGQRGSTIVAGHMGQDHVHMRIRIPPKYAVAEVIGYIKGKSAIAVADSSADDKETCMENASGRAGMRCPRLVVRKRRFAPLSSIRSSSTPKARMSQVSSNNVTHDPGSP
jgi:putative transposase